MKALFAVVVLFALICSVSATASFAGFWVDPFYGNTITICQTGNFLNGTFSNAAYFGAYLNTSTFATGWAYIGHTNINNPGNTATFQWFLQQNNMVISGNMTNPTGTVSFSFQRQSGNLVPNGNQCFLINNTGVLATNTQGLIGTWYGGGAQADRWDLCFSATPGPNGQQAIYGSSGSGADGRYYTGYTPDGGITFYGAWYSLTGQVGSQVLIARSTTVTQGWYFLGVTSNEGSVTTYLTRANTQPTDVRNCRRNQAALTAGSSQNTVSSMLATCAALLIALTLFF